MRNFEGKRYWLVGASEGLGAALAGRLSRAGAELILSARSEDRLTELSADLPRTSVQVVDVTDTSSVEAAARAIGPVDGIVYLAGAYWPMGPESWDTDKAAAMIDVNLTGALRVLGETLPDMLDRGQGHIVLTGSLSAYRGLPGAVGYAASKAGMMSLAETLRLDLRGTGVEVQLANPGFIRTRLTDKNDFAMPQIMDPEEAAQTMVELMGGTRFKMAFPTPFAWAFRLMNLIPDWAYFRLFR